MLNPLSRCEPRPASNSDPSSAAVAETAERIFFTYLSGGEPASAGGAGQPPLSRPSALWSDFLNIEEYRRGPGEIPECSCREDIISMCLSPSNTVEWRIAGERTRSAVIGPGDLSIVSRGTPIFVRWSQEADILVVALDPMFVEAVAIQSGHLDGVEFITNPGVFKDPAIEHIILALRAELNEGCPAGRLFGESLVTALATHVLRRYSAVPLKLVESGGGLPPGKLRHVIEYVQEHLGEDTSLSQLADRVQMSPYHFAHLFKQSTGLPPHKYVLQQRIAKAKRLLADRRHSLVEITYALGFPSQAHFTTVFRKLVGVTPGLYREGTMRRSEDLEA